MKRYNLGLLQLTAAFMIATAGLAADTRADDACCEISCDTDCCDSYGHRHEWLDKLKCHLDGTRWIKPSDHGFDDFISPMINFVFFEDPRTVTELRPIYLNHNVPSTIGSNIAAGGSVQLYAMEIRLRLTEKLSLIATKDGYIVDNTGGTLTTILDDGWADVTLGLKYNVLRDRCKGRLASIGFTYELPIGSTRALQDIGDGEFHMFLTAGQRLLDGDAHFLTSVGYRLPVDTAVQNSAIHWSNHLDYRIHKKLYVLTELAWWHWTDDASDPAAAALGVAGQDLFNLSVNNIAGNNLVTQNVGVKYKPNGHIEAGVAYEFPLTEFKDIIDNRLQVDLILRY